MSVGLISSFDNLQSSHAITGTLHKLNVVTGAADFTTDVNRSVPTAWTFGSGSPGYVNQVVEVIFVATKNTTTTLTLTGVLTNRIGDLICTFTKVKLFKAEYLTVAQDSTNGTASTGIVTIAPGGTNPVTTSPLGSAQTFAINPGAILHWEDPGNGFTVSNTAKTFDFTHSDTSADAHFRITLYGEK